MLHDQPPSLQFCAELNTLKKMVLTIIQQKKQPMKKVKTCLLGVTLQFSGVFSSCLHTTWFFNYNKMTKETIFGALFSYVSTRKKAKC